MGAWRRLRRLLNARLIAGWFRDPERALTRMCDALAQRLLDGLAEMNAGEGEVRHLAALAADAEWLAAHMRASARNALRAGREDWAREAAARYVHAQQRAQLLARHWSQQQQGLARLRRALAMLEMRLSALEKQRNALAARRRLLNAERLLLRGLYGEQLRLALAMAEEKTVSEEYALEAYGQLLADQPDAALPAPATIEQIERALAQLKSEVTRRE